jgi:sugar porter (SP) family MFS transporter
MGLIRRSRTASALSPNISGAADARRKIPPVLIYFFGALEGFVFGYDTGVVAGALLFVEKDMALTPAMQGLVVSALLFGAIVVAPVSGYVSDRIGARRLLMAASLFFLVGSLGCSASVHPTTLIAFRFVLGIGIGIGAVQVPVYLAELSPASSRGRITSLYQLMVATGIFVAYIVGYVLSKSGDWRTMFLVAAVPAALLFGGVLLLPESPRWLAKKGRVAEARDILLRTRTPEQAEQEYNGIASLAPQAKFSWSNFLRDRWLRRALLLAIAFAAFQQALGINTIVYYSPSILHAAGFPASAAILVAVGLQGLSIVMTLTLGGIVDWVGRRRLLMSGALAMATSMAILGAIFQFGLLNGGLGAGVAVACLAVFKAAFSLSWGPVLWIVLPELLPLHGRGPTMGACVFTNFAMNFVIASVFPILLASGTAVAFGTFAICGVAACVLTARLLPETARRTLEEIEFSGSAACQARSRSGPLGRGISSTLTSVGKAQAHDA